MALRTKRMNASQAEKLADLHREMARQAAGSANKSNMTTVLTAVGTTIIGSFIGTATAGISTLVTLFIGIASTSDKSGTASYLRGAEAGFNEIARTLRSGGYIAAEVEQVWIKYTSVSTQHEFVQGNEQNPGKGYRVVRLQTSSGGWITL